MSSNDDIQCKSWIEEEKKELKKRWKEQSKRLQHFIVFGEWPEDEHKHTNKQGEDIQAVSGDRKPDTGTEQTETN